MFFLQYVLLQFYAGSNPISGSVIFPFLSIFFIPILAYNEPYYTLDYARHKLESIKDWKLSLRIELKMKKWSLTGFVPAICRLWVQSANQYTMGSNGFWGKIELIRFDFEI